ncbi:MAG: dipeptide ABC transporter ATP-binding protein [Proteobacteria bacterium]|nr:dipeptide ABC transporter ATP-binding protein [Pseudomonadota bacterium]NIS69056.1 dipeptide ABC transporter ATP-binding protein [Pseudomonadota bacterium]
MTNDARSATVLEVDNLQISYETRRGDVEAVEGASFTVREGETIGLVGESGCGKSTIAFGIVNFLGPNGKIVDGTIRFQGNELVGRSQDELKALRGDRIAMVFQDPMQALNPSVRLGEQLTEVLTCHRRDISREEAWKRSVQMLKKVHMPDVENVMIRYPHQISGGQQQRVVIAMAMLNNPALLIMDEPTTALDVTVEAAVLDLLEELKKDFHAANIFITHNLGVVARVSDYLCVMYAGQMVERGPLSEIFRNPRHPYTMGLLACVPRLGESKLESLLEPIRGRVPPPAERSKTECIFAPRCDYVTEECRKARPSFREITPEHVARCIYALEIGKQPQTSRRQQKVEKELAQPKPPEEDLLAFEGLKIYYPQESNSVVSLFGLGEKKFVKAVDDVSLRVARGRSLGVVGESGCGKSTLVKGLIGLEPVTDGGVEFLGFDATQSISVRDTRLIQEMQMVFQNPDSTLNPSYSVGTQIARPIRKFRTVPKNQVKSEVIRLLKAVRLPPTYYDRLPRQLSGGEKQRIGIARALASRPDLIICDEPVSALDVSVQAAVINLLLEIQQVFGSSMIFIAHDLSVVRFFSDDIAVMYLGQIVEIGPAEAIYAPPYHPYTEALLSAVPIPDPDAEQKEIRLSGNVPSALNPPSGCRFHTRCPRRQEMLPDDGRICETEVPPWRASEKGHRILCHIPIEDLEKVEPVVHSHREVA